MAQTSARNTNQKREYYADSVYVDGNTVRRAQAVPERREETVPERREDRVPAKSKEQLRAERERQRAASRNVERAMRLNRGYVVFLSFATAVCFVACLALIHLQSDISAHMSEISSMETTLSNQKAENDLYASRIETGMTLSEVKERAEEMGLVYPSTAQIRYFSVEDGDYMNQYTDVASR